MRLSIDRDFDPGANENVLSSTLVRLYRAMPHSLRVVLFADRRSGFALISFKNNFESRNLN